MTWTFASVLCFVVSLGSFVMAHVAAWTQDYARGAYFMISTLIWWKLSCFTGKVAEAYGDTKIHKSWLWKGLSK